MNYRWCCVEADHGTAISHQALMHLHTHSYTTRCTSTRATHGERRTQQGQRKMMCATNIPNPKWKWIHSFASASRLNAQGHHLFCFYTRRPTTRTNFMICTHINGEWLAPERVYTQFSGQTGPTEAITFLLFGIRHIFLCLLHFITCVFGSQPSIGSVTAANLRFEGNSNLCLYAAYNKWMRRLLVFFFTSSSS